MNNFLQLYLLIRTILLLEDSLQHCVLQKLAFLNVSENSQERNPNMVSYASMLR